MNKKRLLVHIGVPKSATTSLQFGAFPEHPDIRYLGKPYYDADFGYDGSLATAELADSLWKQDDLEFDLELARRRFDAGILPRLSTDRLGVLSEEGLSQASAADRCSTARRLAGLCDDIESFILITIREQKSALFSGHQWIYTRRLTSLGSDAWIRWCQSYSSYYGCRNDFPLRQYRYIRLIETYIALFGREHVLVLPMEMLSTDPKSFFRRFEEFAGLRRFWSDENDQGLAVENRSPGRWGIRYQRAIKGFKQLYRHASGNAAAPSEALETGVMHSTIMHLIGRVDSPMRPMSVATASWLDEYYRSDNAALAALMGLDLSEYGYAC